MSFLEWVGRQERNKKKALIYGMIGIPRTDKLFREHPNLSLADQTKIAQTMISENQLDMTQVYEQAQKEDDPIEYYEETFRVDVGDLKKHEYSVYFNLRDNLQKQALAKYKLEVAKNKSINKHEKAVFNKINKEYGIISTAYNRIDNVFMQSYPELGLRYEKDVKTGKYQRVKTVTVTDDHYKQIHKNVEPTLKLKGQLGVKIANLYNALEDEFAKGVRRYAFIGKAGEERVKGKNYFELINGEPSEEMTEALKGEEWDPKNIEYTGSPGSMDDAIVQATLYELKDLIDISQLKTDTGSYMEVGDIKMRSGGQTPKQIRNNWYKGMLNEYRTFDESLIKASTVTLEEEPEEEVDDDPLGILPE